MWWKLSILCIVTGGLILSIIPIRTHAVVVAADNPPPQTDWSLSTLVSNMYFTPGSLALIGLILVIAGYIGFRIVRGS